MLLHAASTMSAPAESGPRREDLVDLLRQWPPYSAANAVRNSVSSSDFPSMTSAVGLIRNQTA